MKLSPISACLLILPIVACSRPTEFREARNAGPGADQAFASSSAFAPSPSSADGAGSPAPVSAEPASAAPANAAPMAPAGSGSMAARSARLGQGYEPEARKKAEDRPGLGTTWGETRKSFVSSVPFDRADASRPFALISLNYNDESGIQAMARRAGNAYASFDRSSVDAAQGAVSVRLLDDGGSPLRSASFGGRDYVAGADGQRYVIQIENHTGNRFEAVATVDGLDVMDGKSGSFSKRGYLVNPWSTVEIDGFRRSEAAVAAFRFGKVADSYAARTGDSRNVGVIGVAFFHEQGSSWPWTERELGRRDSANPFPGSFAAPPPSVPAR